MEFLSTNYSWLRGKLEPLEESTYFIFDCPGQVELYTHHTSFRDIVQRLGKADYRLVAVHLVDALLCSDPANFISAVLVSLSTMLRLELPHLNVLSKIDLVESLGPLPFNLDFYKDAVDLNYLVPHIGRGAGRIRVGVAPDDDDDDDASGGSGRGADDSDGDADAASGGGADARAPLTGASGALPAPAAPAQHRRLGQRFKRRRGCGWRRGARRARRWRWLRLRDGRVPPARPQP
jgi:hypothetical protein